MSALHMSSHSSSAAEIEPYEWPSEFSSHSTILPSPCLYGLKRTLPPMPATKSICTSMFLKNCDVIW